MPFDNARVRIVGSTHQRCFVIEWFNEFTDVSFNVMDVYRWVMAIEIVFSNRHKLQRYCVDRLVPFGQQGIPRNRAIANHPLTIWMPEEV